MIWVKVKDWEEKFTSQILNSPLVASIKGVKYSYSTSSTLIIFHKRCPWMLKIYLIYAPTLCEHLMLDQTETVKPNENTTEILLHLKRKLVFLPKNGSLIFSKYIVATKEFHYLHYNFTQVVKCTAARNTFFRTFLNASPCSETVHNFSLS